MGTGGGYPAEARNEEEFSMWEAVGFEEIGDSRIMFLYASDGPSEWM